MIQRDLKHPWIDEEIAAGIKNNPHTASVPTGATRNLGPDGIPAFREEAKLMFTDDLTLSQGGKIEFEEIDIPGLDDDPGIPAIILRPAGLEDRRPVLCITHIGGKIVSHPRMGLHSGGILDWVINFGLIVVVAAIRPGPENRHPAQVRDGFAAVQWVAENTSKLGALDEVSLAGFSGGGGVAAGTALYARDHGGPQLHRLILVSPMLDDRAIFPSNQFEDVIWDRFANRTGWEAMLGDKVAGTEVSAYAAPSRATDLSGLPPTYLDAGSADIFRDETIDFGGRLAQAGVPVDLHIWAGVMHGSEGMVPKAQVNIAAAEARNSYFRRAFNAES